MTKQRTEVVIEGTHNSTLGRNGDLAQWYEIEFKCKPGVVSRRPCVISPYHYRLDWLMWFAAFQVRAIAQRVARVSNCFRNSDSLLQEYVLLAVVVSECSPIMYACEYLCYFIVFMCFGRVHYFVYWYTLVRS